MCLGLRTRRDTHRSLRDSAEALAYQLATMAGGDFKTNTLIDAKEVSTNDTLWRF
jgi:hypothetical protein